MMIVHEFGHVVGAWMTGGTVTRVVLSPLKISRTDVSPNPNPGIVSWAGPIIGVVVPLVFYLSGIVFKTSWIFLARFFAGFCLIANGAYLAIGSLQKIGDAKTMLQHGTPLITLWIFGIVCIPMGLLCWHDLGKDFGLGQTEGKITGRKATFVTCLLALTVIAMILLGKTD